MQDQPCSSAITTTTAAITATSGIRHLDNMISSFSYRPTVLAVLGAFIVLLLLARSFYRSWSRLRHIPGPPGAGLSKWWMLRNAMGGDMHLALKAVVDEYGPLARIGPNTLVTSDPEVLRKLWAVRSPYKKSDFYQAVRWDPVRDNLISMRDDDEHSVLRNKMAAGYAGKGNENLESVIDNGISSLISLIERSYVSDKVAFRPMDLARKIHFASLDIIGLLGIGERFGFTDEDRDVHQYINILESSMTMMIILTVFPGIAKITQSRLIRRLMPSEHDRVGFGVFIGVAKKYVNERLASGNPYRRDMLGSFLAHGLTREEAQGELLVQIVAGSDTTATAIRMALLYAMSSPVVYGRLVAEIRRWASNSLAATGGVSVPVTDAEARALPYLQAVIKESMRMHPPVAGLMGVIVPPGGDVLCGLDVPQGTEVGWSAFALQRREEIYGADAACFRPERWLDADKESLKAMNSTWDLIFKYGKWQCLGKLVAQMEINKMLVELLRRYDFALLDAARPMKSEFAGIFLQRELMVQVTRATP